MDVETNRENTTSNRPKENNSDNETGSENLDLLEFQLKLEKSTM
jgi:hypothetical protein